MTLKELIIVADHSITDCDKTNPAYAPLGNGYVHFVANWLLASYPELDLKIINAGISGNTSRDMAKRWQSDCIDLKPDVLSILIGVNDCWRRHREPNRLPDSVSPQEYETLYRQLLDNVDCQLILIEPFIFCDNSSNPMLKDLLSYISAVQRIANQKNALLIPIQTIIRDSMRSVPTEKWACDMVHPKTWVHAWIAQHWLAATKIWCPAVIS